ncbi:MAG TPA: HD domain-containing protein, partial [Lachnospiraceae bacterium]|nr:HD domain-containing protein [Lachnospiraceae bacterium]
MDRVNRLLHNINYRAYLKEIEELEDGRRFCKHDMNHLMDVARIMMILKLEDGVDLPKETIYMTALLHDIGRGVQLKSGVPHEEAGAEIAEAILRECGYDDEAEIAQMIKAIQNHRNAEVKCDKDLNGLLYRAD